MLARWVVHPRAGPLGATLTNDFEQCLQSYVGARASFEKGRVEGLKISPWAPQKESKIVSKCALGGPGELKPMFERFWVSFGMLFGGLKLLKIDAKIEPQIE